MVFLFYRPLATVYLLLALTTECTTTITSAEATIISTETCEFRTINYITDVLPQQCLRSTWTSAGTSTTISPVSTASTIEVTVSIATEQAASASDATIPTTSAEVTQETISITTVVESAATSADAAPTTSSVPTDSSPSEPDHEELDDDSFMSFEEWRKKNEEKFDQENAASARKLKDRRRESEGIQNHLDSLGDEGELDLDFDAFKTEKRETPGRSRQQGDNQADDDLDKEKLTKKDKSRGRDAGRTCKERTNYASFDAGAIVRETHKGAKNAKAILIEHKDSYMLSECKIKNKFMIIELSEEVWIDTLVLANYEFFSSMIRTFRVSISDRYSVKTEKWKEIGTYEARNSREIQAFLIKNPHIWGRYLRIEFLTHYGNEYYCPLSLIRVHGARMLESLKEGDGNNEEEDDDLEPTEDSTVSEQSVQDPAIETVSVDEKLQAELKEAQAAIENLVKEAQEITGTMSTHSIDVERLEEVGTTLENIVHEQMTTTPWVKDFDFDAWMSVNQGLDVCLPKEAPILESTHPMTTTEIINAATLTTQPAPTSRDVLVDSTIASITTATGSSTLPSTSSSIVPESYVTHSSTASQASQSSITPTTVESSTSSSGSYSSTSASIMSSAARLQNATSSIKSRMSSTTSAIVAAPTQGESFFKAVSRRLQLLEANSTMSLKYIEAQSKALREAFSRVDKRQLNKTTTFLDTLNSTVLTELKEIRQQYDEIWQSTIISLESQRAESRKEMLALTTRLNILADEVIFQKRMSIVQSVLLLLCLGLVIFSRVSTGLPMNFSSRSRHLHTYGVESPLMSQPGSPEYEGLEETPERTNGPILVQTDGGVYTTDDDDIIYEEEEDGSQYDLDASEDDNANSKTPRSPPTPTSLYSDTSSIEETPPHDRAPTPLIFDNMPQLKRSASSSFSLHLNHEKSLQSRHAVLHPRLSKSNSSDSIPSIRKRTKPDVSRMSNVHVPSRDHTPSCFQQVRSEEKPLPEIHGAYEHQGHSSRKGSFPERYLSSPAFSDNSAATDGSLPPPYTNGSMTDNGPLPALPVSARTSPFSPSERRDRNRTITNGSVGTAKKPLPDLPNEDDDNDGHDGYEEKEFDEKRG